MLGTLRLTGFARAPVKGLLGLLVVAGWATSTVLACNVPVFRYALERWQPDPYHLTIFHADGGEAAIREAAIREALDSLGKRPLRLHAELIALDSLEEGDWRLENVEIDRERLPWAVLRYPPRPGRSMPVVWSGTWTAESLDSLANSPMREEIVRRILLGESAVWVLVESGDSEKDRTARECLTRELVEVKQKLQIPGTEELNYLPADSDTPGPEVLAMQEPTEAIPLKIEFSLVSLSRDNAAERSLLAMLLGSEPDLDEYAGEPMVFPIFGQARILWAIVGAGINAENIHESCGFLTGACSCQVKHMNPGTDLLVEFDWVGALEGRVPPPPEITAEMLTVVAPRLHEGEEPPHPTDPPDGTPAAMGAVCPVAHGLSVQGLPQADLAEGAEGAETPRGPSLFAEPLFAKPFFAKPLFVMTGVVLGGLLLVVAGATVIVLRRKGP
ncbi:MAG: hypothetical protein U1E05_24685 [Patescibacteria group bacterium]|nr:hypothetical protein [Patescibacteria group bacterium]